MIETIRRPLKAFHQFCFLEIDPFIIGLYRISLGSLLLLYYVMLFPNWIRYYGSQGYFDLSFSPWPSPDRLRSVLDHLGSDRALWYFYGISCLACLLLIFGILSRLSVAWLWMMNFSLMYRIVNIANGEEQVLSVILFLSMFIPLSSSLTVFHFLGLKKSATKVTAWAMRVLQVQLALIYFLSLYTKYTEEPAWLEGGIVYFAVESIPYSRWPGLPLMTWADGFISKVLTYYTLLTETSFPLLVWFRRFRFPLTFMAITLHIGIAIFLEGLVLFNLFFAAGLILFLPSRRLKGWLVNLCPILLKFK